MYYITTNTGRRMQVNGMVDSGINATDMPDMPKDKPLHMQDDLMSDRNPIGALNEQLIKLMNIRNASDNEMPNRRRYSRDN